ncbi:MAG: threonine aldolase family protein [Hyphomicrobiaceae bacterium]
MGSGDWSSSQFASDNNAGMCPEALERFLAANSAGHVTGYGDDWWTNKASDRLREIFETDADVHFVFNGTAANALALAQMMQPFHAAIVHASSHVELDEAGAPSFYSGGAKLIPVHTPNAKLTEASVISHASKLIGVHHVKVTALSVTNSTELGTVYSATELQTLGETARKHRLRMHLDGARFANAVVATGASPAELSWKAGVDILCLGGVKNGLAVGECVMIFAKELREEFGWRVKQAGQLNSKMRLVAAPWLGLLDNETWLKNAQHANAMAALLSSQLRNVPDIEILYPVDANVVFVGLPEHIQRGLRARGWSFYTFLPPVGCRLMCAWDTQRAAIDRFVADLRAIASG